MKDRQPVVRRRNWTIWILLGLLAASGLAFTAWQNGQVGQAAAATPTPAYQTTTVSRGDLNLTASGNGSLSPAQTVALGFATNGKLATLNVQLGDHVKAGQVLAEQEGIDRLKVNVQTQQVAVEAAQKALDDLQANAAGGVAQALATQAASQAAVATAQAGVHYKGDPRCAPSLTEEYYFKYLYAQETVNYWQNQVNNPKSGYGWQYVLQNLNPAKTTRDLAYYNYVYCQGYTAQEIASSQASLQAAQVNAKQAETNYQNIKANNGVDPNQLALDQAQLANAQAQLAKAEADLQGATIVAPLDGVVTFVNGAVGSIAGPASPTTTPEPTSQANRETGQGPIITLADMSHPIVSVYIDETDLQSFAVGCTAQVAFDTTPGKTFPGVVDEIAPTLATVNNAPEAQGQVTLNTLPSGTQMPPIGTDAIINVACKAAQNVLLVPIQALYQPTGQSAYVYILNQQGQPEKRVVQVGLNSTSVVEIRSGLSQGDRVILSSVKTPTPGAAQ